MTHGTRPTASTARGSLAGRMHQTGNLGFWRIDGQRSGRASLSRGSSRRNPPAPCQRPRCSNLAKIVIHRKMCELCGMLMVFQPKAGVADEIF